MMQLRSDNIERLRREKFDVLILGGGINGAVSAAALAAKGVKVALIDKGDFAGQTSSNSSNLIWGGIKYLESWEFLLVNKLCKSRNQLMRSYPSTVKEVRFLTSIQSGFRFPPFLVYLGTLLYWLMGRCFTRGPHYFGRAKLKQREPVINTDNVSGGFEYSDCYLYDNDSRFVFNFIRSAMDKGCVAANYVESVQCQRAGGQWQAQVLDGISGEQFTISAKVVINACGPLVDTHNQKIKQVTEHSHLFSKGIHLVVDKITQIERVLAFFASDGRLFFVIPMGNKTCIGTTDNQVDKPSSEVSEADRQFVLDNANTLLKLEQPLRREDIISERCGVRPLALAGRDGVADWVKLSRKHVVEVNQAEAHLSIFGGKLTDCINVGDEITAWVAKLGVAVPEPDKIWYGEAGTDAKQDFLHRAKAIGLDALTPESSSEPLSERFWRRYGLRALGLLDAIAADPKQAQLLFAKAEYTRCEVALAAKDEMITKLEDFLRRRSKIEMVLNRQDIIASADLLALCQVLFNQQAEQKMQEYIGAENEPAMATINK